MKIQSRYAFLIIKGKKLQVMQNLVLLNLWSLY